MGNDRTVGVGRVKRCHRCSLEGVRDVYHPLEAFGVDRAKRDGLKSSCKRWRKKSSQEDGITAERRRAAAERRFQQRMNEILRRWRRVESRV